MWPTFYIPAVVTGAPTAPHISHDNGCGTEAPFAPINLTGLRVGDFMVWICVTNVGTIPSPSAALMPPTGWKIFSADPGRLNSNEPGIVVFYKWAEAADLDPDTLYVAEFMNNPMGGYPYRVCSITYAYRNVHPNLPFGAVSMSRSSTTADWKTYEPHILRIGHDNSPCITVAGSLAYGSTGMWGSQSANPLGPVLEDSYGHEVANILGGSTTGSCAYITGSRIGSISECENWIAGETVTSSALGGGWTPFQLSSRVMSGNHCRLYVGASSGAGRHYIEYEVHLTAGEKYTFHRSRRGPYRAGNNAAQGISYVDPDGNERGMIVHNNFNVDNILDPLSDLDDVWFYNVIKESEDAIPSTTGSVDIIYFTAQSTGTYKLRISVVYAYHLGNGVYSTSWTLTPTFSDYREVRAICFRRGWTPAYFQPTPSGPVMAGDTTNGALGSGWFQFKFNDANSCPGDVCAHLAFSINLNTTLLPDRLSNNFYHGDVTGLTENLTVYPTYVTSNDEGAKAISQRPVMPRIDSTLKRYYFEVTSLNTRHIIFGFRMGCSGNGGGYLYNTLTGQTTIPNANASTVTLTSSITPAVGDVWGCEMDFVNEQTVFYRNGTELGRVDLINDYGVTSDNNAGKSTWDCAWYAFIDNMRQSYPFGWAHVTVNLAGPFEHQPAGTTAFDWAAG